MLPSRALSFVAVSNALFKPSTAIILVCPNGLSPILVCDELGSWARVTLSDIWLWKVVETFADAIFEVSTSYAL